MKHPLLLLPALMLILASCTPVGGLISAATTAGSFAMEERGLEGAKNDFRAKAAIVSSWASNDLSFASNLSAIVYNSRAMIVGEVETEEERAEAIALAWQVEGVENVINEIRLKNEGSIEGFAHDTWIETKLSAATMLDGQLLHDNYKFTVNDGTVYVIGMAQSNGELNRFIAHAKSVEYVKKVINHVEVKKRKSMFRENHNSQPQSDTVDP